MSDFWTYLDTFAPHLPWTHWVVMGLVALASALICLGRKRMGAYGAVALGLTVFIGLYLLDALALARHWGIVPVWHRAGIDLGAEWDLLLHGGSVRRIEMLANALVFVPFGFFLSVFLASAKRPGAWRRIGLVALSALGLSLCIEYLQLALHLGFFELTDLVMNTAGAVAGAAIMLYRPERATHF